MCLQNPLTLYSADASLSEAKELFALSRVEGTPEFKFTTYSSRDEYIDYFYSNRKGIINTTGVYQDEKEMPNETEPSDHIMLTCKFDINLSSSVLI
jgi:hypothetical protein